MKIGAGTSCNENGRNLKLLIQIAHTADKRSDWLLAVGHHALHQFIAYHEIRGGSILVNQEKSGAGFHSFDYIGGL